MAHDIDTVFGWRGRTVVDRSGEKIGTLQELHLGAGTDRPDWGAVKTGLLGGRALVPLAGAEEVDDDLRIPIDADRVKDAPGIDAGATLTPGEEHALHRHYAGGGSERDDAGGHGGAGERGDAEG